jgi:hypothetical protein
LVEILVNLIETAPAGEDAVLELYRRDAAEHPSDNYVPGREDRDPLDNGQLQFHKAPHVFRLLAPGNGFGKTTCAIVEADWWLQDSHPYQETPHRPTILVWICQKFQQFEIQKAKQLESWLTPGWSWNGQYHFYQWPNGSRMFVISDDGDWGTVQGIELDLVISDEECDPRLWREMRQRRRAGSQTRYVVAATATKGLRWMYKDLYLPWKQYHEKRGLAERDAMRQQLHEYDDPELAGVPGIFCWPHGGLEDNPAASAADAALYRQVQWGSEAEAQVRRGGGFLDFAGQPVFNLMNLNAMRDHLLDGRAGVIELVPPPKAA